MKQQTPTICSTPHSQATVLVYRSNGQLVCVLFNLMIVDQGHLDNRVFVSQEDSHRFMIIMINKQGALTIRQDFHVCIIQNDPQNTSIIR